MDEPASDRPQQEPSQDDDGPSLGALAEKLVLAGLGAVGVTKERAESMLVGTGSGQPLRERASTALTGLLDDLGLAKRERLEELELRLAQLEHRIRLLEQEREQPGPPAA
jgi:hypothetical protein